MLPLCSLVVGYADTSPVQLWTHYAALSSVETSRLILHMWLLQVTDIEPDSKVRTAMNEINAAQRMRMAAKEKAEADRVMVVTRAQGAPALPLFFLHPGCCLVIGIFIGVMASIPWSAEFAKRLSNISDVVLQVMLRPSILRYNFLSL